MYTDKDIVEVDISDPHIYAAKQMSDPDMPTCHEATKGEHEAEYIATMNTEVKSLLNQKTWTTKSRSKATKVITSTWFFKLNRLPDGTPSKCKAHFFVRGDLIPNVHTCCTMVHCPHVTDLSTQRSLGDETSRLYNAFAQREMGEAVYV
jgi:hypothetical protein